MADRQKAKRKGKDIMLLKDYIENKELSIASEIYNANFSSVDDVVALMANIEKESKEFDHIGERYNTILYNIKVCLSHIAKEKKELQCLHEFAKSRIAKLIKQFIETKDKEVFSEIEREIADNNIFHVVIVPEHKQGSGERMYGIPSCAFFNVVSCNKYYTFDNYDVNDDILQVNENINQWEKEINHWIDEKGKLYDEYGFQNLVPLFNEFTKKYGGLTADNKWEDWYLNSYDEEEYED